MFPSSRREQLCRVEYSFKLLTLYIKYLWPHPSTADDNFIINYIVVYSSLFVNIIIVRLWKKLLFFFYFTNVEILLEWSNWAKCSNTIRDEIIRRRQSKNWIFFFYKSFDIKNESFWKNKNSEWLNNEGTMANLTIQNSRL